LLYNLPEECLAEIALVFLIDFRVVRKDSVFCPTDNGVFEQKRLGGVDDEVLSFGELLEIVNVFVSHGFH